MQEEKLVELVTREVLRRLAEGPAEAPEKAPGRPKNILALFTGGTIGLEQGLTALAGLKPLAAVSVVLSEAAEQVVGKDRIYGRLGGETPVVTACCPYPGKILRAADVVVIPVLTQNTAAKLAHTLSDTMVTTLVLQALMLGKPVIVAANAADPRDSWRASAGMGRSPAGLVRALQDNLKKLEGLGAVLVDAGSLAAECRKYLAAKEQEAPVGRPGTGRRLIDAGAVREAALAGSGKRLKVPAGALVTPLARDMAGELGVELVREERRS
ncbi:MAG TPA: flavoprotein [Selenomonadales bacterium]|nr:flavoprotein [Selenomonadales bacterium]